MLDDDTEVLSTSFGGPNQCIRVDSESCCRTTSRNPTTYSTVLVAYKNIRSSRIPPDVKNNHRNHLCPKFRSANASKHTMERSPYAPL